MLPVQFVFPDAGDTPTTGAQRAGDEAIAGAVGGEFIFPERSVLFRVSAVDRAAVPEAGIQPEAAGACFPSGLPQNASSG